MNRSIFKQIKSNIINNNRIFNKINHQNGFYNNNIIYRNFTNSINNNDNNNNDKIRISKELENLGVYYSSEDQDNHLFTEDYEEDEDYESEDLNSNDKKELYENYQKLKQQQEDTSEESATTAAASFGNFEEYLQNGKKFQDMIYRIKDNYEQSQVERKRLMLDDMEFESFEDLEKRIEEKMNKKYEEKEKKLSTLTESDFLDYDQSKIQVFNKVSDSFIQAKTHFDTPFEKTEKQLESNEINELPEGIDTMMTDNSIIISSSNNNIHSKLTTPVFNKADEQKNDIASRISKIKQRISKDKINVNRIGGEDLNELFSLYREDPLKNNAESLSKQFNLNQKSLENLLKYTTIPIIVKYNTGLKTGHWNVIFEK